MTDPPRTATEQFLMSEASSRAIDKLSVTAMRDRAVYIDQRFLAPSGAQMSPDQTFAIGELRARLLLAGARLTESRDKSQITVEVRSEGIGIDRIEFLLGIPAIYLPGAASPAGGIPIATPELAIVKRTKQRGFSGMAYVAYWNDTGEVVASAGPAVGRTARDDFWFLGLGPNTVGDIAPAQPLSPNATTRPTTAPSTTTPSS